MHMQFAGTDGDGGAKELNWYLQAENNHGPEIPCIPAIILVRKLARGEIPTRGAMHCLGLFSLEDFDRETDSLQIAWQVDP